MTTTLVITTAFDTVALSITPLERLKAMGSRLGTNFIDANWFVLAALVAITILTAVLVVISYNRKVQSRRASTRIFDEYARKSGLSKRECEILLQVARKAGLRQSEAIFTMANAFDGGAARMMEENIQEQNQQESERLKNEMSFLREKLGFQKKSLTAVGSPAAARRLSSRQIPVGKKLHITRRKTRNLADIESTVVKNDDVELAIKLAVQVETAPGEFWRARYYFGASVWEFDTSVVSCNGDILVLNHSDDVRFVNRRRFVRVPVNKPAFVARFPFSAEVVLNGDRAKKGPSAAGRSWGPPEFVPAVVTELAGPGLRIELPLDVKMGERVLVVFKLNGKNDQTSGSQETGSAAKAKIIEDVGEVRHTKPIENGFSIAVELTGLGDSDVNELIRATNAASLLTRADNQNTPDAPSDKLKAAESAAELTTVQKV
jgi:hypothetical protein